MNYDGSGNSSKGKLVIMLQRVIERAEVGREGCESGSFAEAAERRKGLMGVSAALLCQSAFCTA